MKTETIFEFHWSQLHKILIVIIWRIVISSIFRAPSPIPSSYQDDILGMKMLWGRVWWLVFRPSLSLIMELDFVKSSTRQLRTISKIWRFQLQVFIFQNLPRMSFRTRLQFRNGAQLWCSGHGEAWKWVRISWGRLHLRWVDYWLMAFGHHFN